MGAALDVPIDGGWNRVIKRDALSEEVPGSISWWEREQRGLAILSGIAILVATALMITALKG